MNDIPFFFNLLGSIAGQKSPMHTINKGIYEMQKLRAGIEPRAQHYVPEYINSAIATSTA